MSYAMLFPGQGSETAGMGLAVAAGDAHARALLDVASEVTGVDVDTVLRRGGRELDRTDVLQPILIAVALGAARVFIEKFGPPGWVAGHSAGEIGALAVAGAIDDAAAVRLAAVRGAIMAREARAHPGSMLAVLCEQESTVRAAIGDADARDTVAIAAHNAPGEWTISGPLGALEAVASALEIRRLRVSGAWHSPAMANGVEELRAAVLDAMRSPPALPMLCNRTGDVADARTLADDLAEQLVRPIRWAETLERLRALGATAFVAVGPGKTLRGLVRRTLGREVRALVVDGMPDIERLGAQPWS